MLSEHAAASLSGAARLLATRINAGARLWVIAPGLEDHARHVALEYVHPASVGAGSVAAMAITDDSPVAELRRHVRVGDVLISLGDAAHPTVVDCSLRVTAWGALHVHLGWCDRGRPLDPATIAVTIGVGPEAERDLTRSHHLLWELAFIARKADGGGPPARDMIGASEATGSCAVCADEASLGEITAVLNSEEASVRTACGTVRIDTSLVDTLRVHDLVLVHAGVAIAHVGGNMS